MRKRNKFVFLLYIFLISALLFLMMSCRKSEGEAPSETDAGSETGTENKTEEFGTHMSDYLKNLCDYTDKLTSSSVSDSLTVGDDSSESSHGLTFSGGTVRGKMTAKTGTLSEEYNVLLFSSKGDGAKFRADLSAPVPQDLSTPVVFEVQEIHEALEQGFAYTVKVNGKAVYYRTYEQIASAPNHWFFEVDRSEISDFGNVEIEFVSDCNTTFAISRVWCYTDFYSLVDSEDINTKLGIYLYGADSVEKANPIYEPYKNMDYKLFYTGVMFRLDYMNLGKDEAIQRLKNYVAVSEGWNVPIQVMSAMYWSSAPYGPDGEGGSFADMKYSQVLYNSISGKYVDTTPNVYSSTPWVTTGNTLLNTAATQKINSLFSAFSKALSLTRAKSTYNNNISYIMEWGVCYKGMGTVTGAGSYGWLDGGDFNAELVKKAAADGITLDPSDGLSYEEKLWLTTWHAEYNQLLADAYHNAFSTDAVIIRNGNITLPQTQQTDNLFSHNVQWINQNPYHDLTLSGWMSGIGNGFYSSSEDMYFDDIRFYQYKTAYGRAGCCNLEMAIHNPSHIISAYIREIYELGLEYVTLFNDKSEYGTASTIASLDNMANERATAPKEYRVNIVNVDFARDVAEKNILNNTAVIAGTSGVTVDMSNGCLVQSGTDTGYIIFRASDAGRQFENGLTLDVQAKFGSGSDTIKIYVGSSPSDMTLYATFIDKGDVDRFNSNWLESYDLSSLTKGKNEYYVKIEISSPSKTASLQYVKIYLNNSAATGQTNDSLPTMIQKRMQNLYVSQRAIALNMYDSYILKNGGTEDIVSQAAKALIANGYVNTAYKLLSGQISELLPAAYTVTGSGSLGRWPVEITLEKTSYTAQITLTEIGREKIAFSIYAERDQNVTFTISELVNGTNYVVTDKGDGSFELTKTDSEGNGVITVADGKLTFTVSVKAEKDKTYTYIEGRAYNDASASSIRVTVQDPEISEYAEYCTFTIDPSCSYTRHSESGGDTVTGSAAKPKTGDYVKLTFNSTGTKVIAIESVWGEKTGVIKTFISPDAQKGINGSVVFEDGTVYEIEYQKYTTMITIGSTNARARELSAEQLTSLLKAGTRIKITYCPESYNGATQRILTITQ